MDSKRRSRSDLTSAVSAGRGDLYVPELFPGTLDTAIAESIDEVLGELLGIRAKEAIYDTLERSHSIARESIPSNLEKLFELFDQTFGRGSRTIGKAIMRKLFEKLGWRFVEVGGFEFFDYLEAVRSRLARELVEQAKQAHLNSPAA